MEWNVTFMGPVGSGKTTAIRTISDIEVVNTDARATDEVARMKSTTTVSMDVGVHMLGDKDKLRLYGTPGQDRFDFMWDILLEQAKAVIILIDHARASRIQDLAHFVQQISSRCAGRKLPMAVGITHTDLASDDSINGYREQLRHMKPAFVSGVPAVFSVDARDIDDVRALVLSVAAMLEMESQFANR